MSLAAAHSRAYKPTEPLATTSARFLGSSRTLLYFSSKNRTSSRSLDSPGLSPLEFHFAKVETLRIGASGHGIFLVVKLASMEVVAPRRQPGQSK